MTTNIIIGVGGTGAKVVEATLHLTAAGLGPAQNLLVGFVDQDRANGNVMRAKQLLAVMRETHRAWRNTGTPHRLGTESTLLKCLVEPLAEDAEVWTPHTDQGITLAQIFERDRMSEGDQHLMDILFAEGAVEQQMPLGEGYRGRPHLGAAAMAAAVDDGDFWKKLIEAIKQDSDVRLVLVGSVFGGTGAAGFPTLARLIRRRLGRERIDAKVSIGGALMLPYFGFRPPESEEGVGGNVARTEQLLIQSREALRYYHHLFGQEQVFDELYFVGWEPYFQFKYHSAGSNEQANPALLPELLAGLGVCRFFNRAHGIDPTLTNPVFVSARRDADAIGWADLPSPGDDDAPYNRLGQMLRFAAAWKQWGGLIGADRNRQIIQLDRDPWYKAQGLKPDHFKRTPPQAELDSLSEYLNSFLEWATAIQHYCRGAGLKFDLWRTDGVVAAIQDDPPNTRLVTLLPGLSEAAYAKVFDDIVVRKAAADRLPDANDLTTRLNNQPFASDDQGFAGIGRMVAAVHAYSAVVD